MNYDYYEPPAYDHYHECTCCNEKDQRIFEASEHMAEVIKQLSSKGPLDLGQLAFNLGETCAYLGIRDGADPYTIIRAFEKTETLIERIA